MRLPLLILAACLLLCAQSASPPAPPQGRPSTVTARAATSPVVTWQRSQFAFTLPLVTVRAAPSPVVTAGGELRLLMRGPAAICSIPLLEAKKGDTHDPINHAVSPAQGADPMPVKAPAPPCNSKSK